MRGSTAMQGRNVALRTTTSLGHGRRDPKDAWHNRYHTLHSTIGTLRWTEKNAAQFADKIVPIEYFMAEVKN